MRIPDQSPGVDRTIWAKIAPAKVDEVGVRPSQYDCGKYYYYCYMCSTFYNHNPNNYNCIGCTWCGSHC